MVAAGLRESDAGLPTMSDNRNTAPETTSLTAFSNAEAFVVGAGETIDELQSNGQWIKTTDPVDVQQ